MKTETIKTPNFTRRIANIIAKIRTVTFIDKIDAEAIKEILQDEINEECRMLDSYYWEEHYNNYCNEITSAQHRAYDEGHSDGYSLGYDEGYSESNS